MAYQISTMKPDQVAAYMVELAVYKHKTHPLKLFMKAVRHFPGCASRPPWLTDPQFSAGILLSFGGLLSELIQGGAGGLNATNPGIVKVLGGFVFPVGLVMCVCLSTQHSSHANAISAPLRIVLGGHELLTSNMMVRGISRTRPDAA